MRVAVRNTVTIPAKERLRQTIGKGRDRIQVKLGRVGTVAGVTREAFVYRSLGEQSPGGGLQDAWRQVQGALPSQWRLEVIAYEGTTTSLPSIGRWRATACRVGRINDCRNGIADDLTGAVGSVLALCWDPGEPEG